MTTILSCNAAFGTFTSPAPAPVPVYGPAAATGSAITVQSDVTEFTLCVVARITRPLAPEITEWACEVFEID